MNFNPYTQGGWSNPDDQNSINNVPWSPSSPPQPCIYGALPFASESSPETMHKFGFEYETSIMNSTVFGPTNKRPFFRVANNLPKEGCTTLTNAEGTDFAVIDWGTEENGGVMDAVERRSEPTGYARFWEMVFMDCEGQMYLSNLATHGSKHPCVYAKIYRDEKLKAVILEVATQAIQLGLLEICIVATVLLQSGNNID
ncbi:hypothetical protein CPB85DRAFT_1524911 [Mucidula mucida]|nr:hypothetical protein CPB85DRAFT_1524911 [Mucidula mucida]